MSSSRMRASFLYLFLTVFFLVPAGCRPVPDPTDPEIIKTKEDNWTRIKVAPGFLLTNNMWGTTENTTQTIYQYTDGSYGWSWERGKTRENGNYPEVVFGVKPWGQHEEYFLEGSGLPLQLEEVASLVMEMDLDYKILHDTGDNAWWNLAFEVWLTEDKPGDKVEDSITDEIMIWFDWKDVPWDPAEEDWEDSEAVKDHQYEYAYCLSVPNWSEENGWGWHYHQFRIKEKGTIPEVVNIKPFLDYIQEEHQRSGRLWLGSLEFGMEYGDHTAGRVHIKKLDYVINGKRVASGRTGK